MPDSSSQSSPLVERVLTALAWGDDGPIPDKFRHDAEIALDELIEQYEVLEQKFADEQLLLMRAENRIEELQEQLETLREVARDFIVHEPLQVTSNRWYALAEALLPAGVRKEDLVNDEIIAYLSAMHGHCAAGNRASSPASRQRLVAGGYEAVHRQRVVSRRPRLL